MLHQVCQPDYYFQLICECFNADLEACQSLSARHNAFLLTSSGQIDVTKWAIGSNDTNHSTSKYEDNKEFY